MVAVAMEKSADPVATGPVKIRSAGGGEVAGPEILWLAGVSGLTPDIAGPMARIAADGGLLVADGATKNFAKPWRRSARSIAISRRSPRCSKISKRRPTKAGRSPATAFGKGPSHGTEAGQQPVTGFAGHGLVNTFIGGDGPQGTATSKKFTIERRYIGFLIGGGNQPGKTCINLLVAENNRPHGDRQRIAKPSSRPVGTSASSKARRRRSKLSTTARKAGGISTSTRSSFPTSRPSRCWSKGTTAESAAKALGVPFTSAEEATLAADATWRSRSKPPPAIKNLAEKSKWAVTNYTRLDRLPLRRTRLSGFGFHGRRAIRW